MTSIIYRIEANMMEQYFCLNLNELDKLEGSEKGILKIININQTGRVPDEIYPMKKMVCAWKMKYRMN